MRPDIIPQPRNNAGPAPTDPPQDVTQDPDTMLTGDVDEMPKEAT